MSNQVMNGKPHRQHDCEIDRRAGSGHVLLGPPTTQRSPVVSSLRRRGFRAQ
jgi:hypothetical protein